MVKRNIYESGLSELNRLESITRLRQRAEARAEMGAGEQQKAAKMWRLLRGKQGCAFSLLELLRANCTQHGSQDLWAHDGL
jgi:hypothetical protein